jgi:hypothetical protein
LQARFLADNAKAAKALAASYLEALDMIAKEQAGAYEIMGADVKQTGEQFGGSAKYVRWQDREANQKFFAGELLAFLLGGCRLAHGDRHVNRALRAENSGAVLRV